MLLNIPGLTAEAAPRRRSEHYLAAGDRYTKQMNYPATHKAVGLACKCDAATDISVCTSGGVMRVSHAVLGEL